MVSASVSGYHFIFIYGNFFIYKNVQFWTIFLYDWGENSIFFRKSKNDDEESAENWYDCLIPNCFKSCAKIFQCCKVPRFITDFQAKLKEAKPSRIRKNWRQQNCLTFLGFLFLAIINLIIICFKPVKFLTFDVVFPAVDVYTDSDAAIKHFA